MVKERIFKNYDRVLVTAAALALAFNLIPGYLVLPFLMTGLAILAFKRGLPVVLVAMVIFSHPAIALVKIRFGVSMTSCIIGLTGVIFLLLLVALLFAIATSLPLLSRWV